MNRQGSVEGIPIDEYHAGPEVSNSALSVLAAKTPAHYKLYTEGKIKRETKSLSLGQHLHCMVLEPEVFAANYAIGPDVRKNSKIWKEFEAENQGKELLKRSEHDELLETKNALLARCKVSEKLLTAPGKTEVSFFWTDEQTGVDCRARADKLIEHDDYAIIVDLKSTRDASPHGFAKAVNNYGYHRQDQFYTQGVSKVLGKPVMFYFIAIEIGSLIPAVYELDEDDKMAGAQEVSELLHRIKEYRALNHWPGYSDQIQTISRKFWNLGGSF